MYYMKLEAGEFTFRPPDHAKVGPDGFTWLVDIEDRSRLEADISRMLDSDPCCQQKGLTIEPEGKKEAEEEVERRAAAAEKAYNLLCHLEEEIESAPHHTDEALHDNQHGAFLRLIENIKDAIWKAY